jgi:hypothetical protein
MQQCTICMEACETKCSCKCAGFVHATCLQSWINARLDRGDDLRKATTCEVCAAPYGARRRHRDDVSLGTFAPLSASNQQASSQPAAGQPGAGQQDVGVPPLPSSVDNAPAVSEAMRVMQALMESQSREPVISPDSYDAAVHPHRPRMEARDAGVSRDDPIHDARRTLTFLNFFFMRLYYALCIVYFACAAVYMVSSKSLGIEQWIMITAASLTTFGVTARYAAVMRSVYPELVAPEASPPQQPVVRVMVLEV